MLGLTRRKETLHCFSPGNLVTVARATAWPAPPCQGWPESQGTGVERRCLFWGVSTPFTLSTPSQSFPFPPNPFPPRFLSLFFLLHSSVSPILPPSLWNAWNVLLLAVSCLWVCVFVSYTYECKARIWRMKKHYAVSLLANSTKVFFFFFSRKAWGH